MSINNKIVYLQRKTYAYGLDFKKLLCRESRWLVGKRTGYRAGGQRRIGKSYVLKDFVLRHEKEPDANVIYIDKEKKEFDSIKDYTALNEYIDARFAVGKQNYILIDEVQDIAE